MSAEDQEELDYDQIDRNTAELGKIILGLSTAGIGMLKFKATALSLFEQLSASLFLASIISLFLAYLFGSHTGIRIVTDSDRRDTLVYWMNHLCNFFFFLGLTLLTISIWK
jgi:hypothetical protein